MPLIFLFTPLINHESLANAATSSKTFFFLYALTILTPWTLCMFLVSKNTLLVRLSKIDAALLLLVAYIVINRYWVHTLQGFSIRFIELAGLSVLYIIVRSAGKKEIFFSLLAISLAGTVLAIYGAVQLLGFSPSFRPSTRIIAGFSNAGPYAGYLVITGAISLSMYLFKEQITATGNKITSALFHIIPLAGMATVLIVLPSARSRAAWIALIPVACLTAWRYKDRLFTFWEKMTKTQRGRKTVLVLLTLIVFSAGLREIYRFNKGSADGRWLIWKVTGHIIHDHFISGVGYDRFKAYYMDAQSNYFTKAHEPADVLLADNTWYAFNEVLQLTAENGVVGFLIVCTVALACVTTRVNKEDTFLKYIVLCVAASVFVFGLFSYPMQILPVKMALVLVLGLLANLDTGKRSIMQKKWQAPIKTVVFLTGITIATWAFMETTTVKTAFKNWQQALTMYDSGMYPESIAAFENAYPALHEEGEFLMQYGKALALAGEYRKAKKILEQSRFYLTTNVTETTLGDVCQALKQYKEAETAYTKAAGMIPNRFYPEYLLAKLYNDTQQPEKAYYTAQRLLGKEIKVHSAAIDEMRAEMKRIVQQCSSYKSPNNH